MEPCHDDSTDASKGWDMKPLRKKDLEHIRFVARDQHVWEFEFPRVGEEELEELDEGIDFIDDAPWRAERIFLGLLKRVPEFIDARHHLALVRYRSKLGSFKDWKDLWEEIAGTLLALIPPEFQIGRDRLPWGYLDNRPFLRGLHSLACGYLDLEDFPAAQVCLEELLLLNPDDNQGCRALLPTCYFERRRAPAVLELSARYGDEWMPDLLWSRILAHFQLGHLDEAREALQAAAEHQPRIFEIIGKGKKPGPNRRTDPIIAMGSAAEAREYWFHNAVYWLRTPGAISFVRSRGVSHAPVSV